MIQGPIFDGAFWLGFWPQLLATVIGVLVGVPVGLALNRLATDTLTAAQKKADAERLDGALASLAASIEMNRGPLRKMAELQTGHYLLEPGVETATWEAVKSEIVALARKPELQGALAVHFASVERAARLCDLLAQHSVGVQSSMSNAAPTRDFIRQRLISEAVPTLELSQTLLTEIADLRKTAAPKK